MNSGKTLGLAFVACMGWWALMTGAAHAQGGPTRVRISDLTDVAFGTISNFTSDRTISQSICVFTRPQGTLYAVTASGNGPSGAFTMSAGASQLAYEVQWDDTPGQTIGTSLTAGVPLSNQASAAQQNSCNNGGGPPSSASLITILRAAAVGSAGAGTYSGTLSLLITPI